MNKKQLGLITVKMISAATLLIFVMQASAADNTVQEANSEMETNQKLTVEYVAEICNLDVSDFDGVDFNEFIETYELNSDNIGEYYLPDLIRFYKREKAVGEVTDYSAIFDNCGGKLTAEDFDKIDVIVWDYHEGNGNKYMVIDFAKKSVYLSYKDIIAECKESDKVADLSQADVEFIKAGLSESKITEWKNEYIGTNEGTTGSFSWSIGVRLADGRCVSYHGNGVVNSGTPAETVALIKNLSAKFKS